MKDIYMAEDISKAQLAIKAFELDYQTRYPKTVGKITDDVDYCSSSTSIRLSTGCSYAPLTHRIHLRHGATPDEGHQGTRVRAAGLVMAYKLIDAAQARWRAVNAPHLVALVRAEAVFRKDKLLERPPISPPAPGLGIQEVDEPASTR
jgi:hypothetical protein